jgi:hypothetical protein
MTKRIKNYYLIRLYYNFFIDILKKKHFQILISLSCSIVSNVTRGYIILTLISYISKKQINFYFYKIDQVDLKFFLIFLLSLFILTSFLNLITEKFKYIIWRDYCYLKLEEYFFFIKKKKFVNNNLKKFIFSINKIGLMAKTSVNIINCIIISLITILLILYLEKQLLLFFFSLIFSAIFFIIFFKEKVFVKNLSYNEFIKNFNTIIIQQRISNNFLEQNNLNIKKFLKISTDKFYISDAKKFKFLALVVSILFLIALLMTSLDILIYINNYEKFSALLVIFIFNLGNLIKQTLNSLRFIEYTDTEKISKITKDNLNDSDV